MYRLIIESNIMTEYLNFNNYNNLLKKLNSLLIYDVRKIEIDRDNNEYKIFIKDYI